MIPIRDLVNTALQAYEEKWGYIFGKSGQVWTQANQDAATRDMTVKYGQKWVGKRVADCSGLFVWAFKQHGGKIYHGSNTIWEKYLVPESRGPLAGVVKIRYGAAVFQVKDGRRTHIGWYIGGGMVEEEKGTQSGCVLSPLATWDEYGELKDADYTGEVYETFNILPLDTLQKGSKSEVVKWYQRCLVELGYDIGKKKDGSPLIDGIYGAEMVSATRAFQSDHGLTPDGKAGKLTLAKIKELMEDDESDEDTEADFDEIVGPESDPEQDAWNTLSIEEKVENLHKRILTLEGGESNV